MVQATCEQCGKSFQVVRKYCSKECCVQAQYKRKEQLRGVTICEYCGREFWASSYVLKRSRRKYCSPECRGRAQHKLPLWPAGWSPDELAARVIGVPDCAFLVYSIVGQRRLGKGEVVRWVSEVARVAAMDALLPGWLTLTQRERGILALLYGEDLTIQEAGGRVGLSGPRIRQIEAKALRKLRHPFWRRVIGGGVERAIEVIYEGGDL